MATVVVSGRSTCPRPIRRQAWEQVRRKAVGYGSQNRRGVDDLVILCWTRGEAEAALQTLRQLLAMIGLEVAEGKTRIVQLKPEAPGIDFLGFHHRMVRSFRYPHRDFLARFPGSMAVTEGNADSAARIRELTDRRWLLRPVPDVVAIVNRFLKGWAAYFRRGNSTRHFHVIDEYVVERVSLLLSKKHGQSGKRYGGYLLGRSLKNMGCIASWVP